jgi:integrase
MCADTVRTPSDKPRLTDKQVRAAAAPADGRLNAILYDGEIKGFGLRVTKDGAKAFVLNYRIAGRERRLTIGSYPDWTMLAAREEAKRLKRLIDVGRDPLAERIAAREAPTVADLIDRYLTDHAPRKRERSRREDEAMIGQWLKPELGNRKVTDIRHADIDALHRKITAAGTPTRANRVIALASRMFTLAIRWEWRGDNPAAGIERNPEEPRQRYLSGDELRRLTAALAAHPNRHAADAIRLLLLTGARRAEVLGATWEQFDLGAGIWTKPSAHTKQKREHRVPLSAPARQLLAEMQAAAERRALATKRELRFAFPARAGDGHMTEIKGAWLAICKAAGLAETVAQVRRGKPVLDADGKPVVVTRTTVRLHDLRHTYASVLASGGHSLPVIGALLGHSQAATTQRYAHLFDDPLRAATERAAAAIAAGPASAKPAALRRKA